jgi:hypothetical protein
MLKYQRLGENAGEKSCEFSIVAQKESVTIFKIIENK